ncbi:hypothetical protein [Geomonas ferrireducens]|uniref:hypothetical protein n=1 Tax=Geomonas ferrireducens TaxID=2570227 RepID=UPI0013A5C066|nr:hypothetical protein [Geomonas ferrireducens]
MSPLLIMTAPLACFAIFPVSMVIVLPQHSACTLCTIVTASIDLLPVGVGAAEKIALRNIKPQDGFIHAPNKEKGHKGPYMMKEERQYTR